LFDYFLGGAIMAIQATAAIRPASRQSFRNIAVWILAVGVMALYGVLVAEYTLKYFYPSAPRLWDTFSASISSRAWSLGKGSVAAYRNLDYLHNRVWMLLHTAGGALCVLLGPWQFSRRLRTRNPGLHRKMGYTYFVAGFVSIVGACGFLINVPIRDVQKDTAFYWALWGLLALETPTMAVALWAAIRRQFALHQNLMALSLTLFATAPVMRSLWFILGGFTTLSQGQANYASAMFLAPLCLMLAIVWTSRQRLPNAFPAIRLPRYLIPALGVLAVAGLLINCVAVQSGSVFSNAEFWFPSSGSGKGALYLIFLAACAAQLLLLGALALERRQGVNPVLCLSAAAASLAAAIAAQAFVGQVALGSASQTSLAFSFGWMGHGLLQCLMAAGAVWLRRQGKPELAREWLLYAATWAFSPLYSLMLYPLASLFYGPDVAWTTAQIQNAFVIAAVYCGVTVIRTWRPAMAGARKA
jgi:hypothetical protein